MSQNSPEKNSPELKTLQSFKKTLLGYIQKPNVYYTGIAIKKYLKKKLNSKGGLTSSPVVSGRWSAYCHYNPVSAFENLLSKQQLNPNANILVHPLLPPEYIEMLSGYKLGSLDIQKNTLNWNAEEVVDLINLSPKNATIGSQNSFDQNSGQNQNIQQNGYLNPGNNQQNSSQNQAYNQFGQQSSNQVYNPSQIDLIVIYNNNGLFEEILPILREAKKKAIPVIIFLDHHLLDVLDLVNELSFGGIIFGGGDSFWDDELAYIYNINRESSKNYKNFDNPFFSQDWYFSIAMEARTRSVLEYHLSDSFQLYEGYLESYYYLVSYYLAKKSLKGQLDHIFTSFLMGKTITSVDFALDYLVKNYDQTLSAAVPDFIFDLELTREDQMEQDQQQYLQSSPIGAKIVNQSPIWQNMERQNSWENNGQSQQTARKYYEYLYAKIQSAGPSSGLELPPFYIQRRYSKYFFYSADKIWAERMVSLFAKVNTDIMLDQNSKKSFFHQRLKYGRYPVHQTFLKMPNLVGLQFVHKYGYWMDI